MGVPGLGFRKFRGTQSTPRSRITSASSTRCSGVSPMPRMPPVHSSSPTDLAARMVSTCSWKVWVVQTWSKNDGADSTLW